MKPATPTANGPDSEIGKASGVWNTSVLRGATRQGCDLPPGADQCFLGSASVQTRGFSSPPLVFNSLPCHLRNSLRGILQELEGRGRGYCGWELFRGIWHCVHGTFSFSPVDFSWPGLQVRRLPAFARRCSDRQKCWVLCPDLFDLKWDGRVVGHPCS